MSVRTLVYAAVVGLLLNAYAFAGFEYEGERNAFNRFHGQGKFTSGLGAVYEGNWVDGRRDGQGTEIKPNGERYDGSWSNNKESGAGKKVWPNGDRYEGQWQAGKMQGEGTFVYANGDRYTGGFDANQPDGKGVLTSENGIVYGGAWKAGKRDGTFKITLKDGSLIQGDWKEGKAPAMAIVEMKDGVKYTGPVRDGMVANGKGTCLNAGQANPCEYRDGKVVVALPKPEPKAKPVVVAVVPVPAAPRMEEIKPVEPPKPKDPRTLRGVRADGSQFFFRHNWNGGGYSDNLGNLKVEKITGKTEILKIAAKGGDIDIDMRIDQYEGEGTYELKYFKGTVQKKGEPSYWVLATEPGKLVVVKDDNKTLTGTFSFTGYPNGNMGADKRQLTEGEFAIPY